MELVIEVFQGSENLHEFLFSLHEHGDPHVETSFFLFESTAWHKDYPSVC